jgi:hypothetical protein
MLSVGLDLHKRYSQVEALEENGDRRSGGRLVNEFEQIEGFFRSLGEPCRVVLEAGWNWGSMYDWLERVENVVEVQLAIRMGFARSRRRRSRRIGSTRGCWGSCCG